MNPIRALQMRPPIVGLGTFAGMASLFTAAEKGAYYDFTDGAKLAVNADGTGGTPSVGSAVRWAADQSPNGNHLRNTTGTVPTRRANGVETTGTGYGLFNMPGFGNWPANGTPYEMLACLEQKTFTATDNYIIGFGGGYLGLLEGSSSGNVRFKSTGYSPEYAPGLLTEYTVDGAFNGASSQFSFNNGSFVTASTTSATNDSVLIGSAGNGAVCSAVRVKRLLFIGRLLTATERAGVYAWASA